MKIEWKIEQADIVRVKEIVAQQRSNPFVQERIRRNLAREKPELTRAAVWREMVGCLLTTQQRSGPDSPVSRFIRKRPFPLNYSTCSTEHDVGGLCRRELVRFGGIRRTPTIAGQLMMNLEKLESGFWAETMRELARLRRPVNQQVEQDVADFVDEEFVGFGPKQARNFLQALGLTRFEIPIDSRITKWLNRAGFPIHLNATGLSDPAYYQFVSAGVQELCKKSQIYPCIFDAAIFSSVDGDRWTDDNLVW
jgi:hypothetical protein